MMMAENYGVFASYLQFKEVLADPVGHLYRAGEFDTSGVRRAAWLRVFDQPHIEASDLEAAFGRARAIADAVQSANVPSGVKCILEADTAAMAIDYTASQPLSLVLDRVAREQFPVPVDNALLIAEKIALALSATLTVEIGGSRVVHGFLHPGLVFITNDGEAIVSGFGIAEGLLSVLDDQSSADATHPYFAPEVVQSRAASARGDVYSLGAILFHLLTGTTLPAAVQDRPGAIDGATMAFEEEPLPDDIKNLLRRALAQQPEGRFSSSADFKKELDRLLYGGAYSPTTFNLALFMDRLFRPELEAEDAAVARELAVDVTPYLSSAPIPEPESVPDIELSDRPPPLRQRQAWIGLGVVGVAVVAGILWLTVFRGPSSPPPTPTPTAEEIAAQRQQQEEKMRELAAGLVAEMMAEKEEEIRQELLARQEKIDELQRRLAASERRAQQGQPSDAEALKREELQRQIAAEEKAQRQREAELEAERLQATEEVRRQATIRQTVTVAAAASEAPTPTLPPMPTVAPTTVPTTLPTSVPTPRSQGPPPVQENTFIDPTEVDSPPAILKEVPVVWPRAALSSRRKGVVVLQVMVDAYGTAEDLRILRADHEGFGIPQAVKEAVTKYRFKPGTKDGVRIKTYLSIVAHYDFSGR